MAELFEHTDDDGERLRVVDTGSRWLRVYVGPVEEDEDGLDERLVFLPHAAGRRLLAALQHHYATPEDPSG